MANKPKPITGVYVDIADFLWTTEEVLFQGEQETCRWLKNLRACLATRDYSKSEYGAKLLSMAEEFRDEVRQRKAESRKNQQEQYQPTNQQEKINVNGNLKTSERESPVEPNRKPDQVHRREVGKNQEPKGDTREIPGTSQETGNNHAGPTNVIQLVQATTAEPKADQKANDLEQVHERRQASGKRLQVFGKTAMEMEYPDAYLVWQAAPAMARSRSSTIEFMKSWREQTKNGGIPPVSEVLASLEKWKRSKKWAENGGEYIEALHRWVNRRQWENPPASAMEMANEQAAEINRMFEG